MLDLQTKAQQQIATQQAQLNATGQAQASAAQRVMTGLAQTAAPTEWQAVLNSRAALQSATTALQAAQQALAAAEQGADVQAEALAVVQLRRATRDHASAQEQAQAAEATLHAAVSQARDQLMAERLHAWNARAQELKAAYAEMERQLLDFQQAADTELQQLMNDTINPLANAGAYLPRRFGSSGLFDLS